MDTRTPYSHYDHLYDQIGRMFQMLTQYKGGSSVMDQPASTGASDTKVHLPTPQVPDKQSFLDLIQSRRSNRAFDARPITTRQLSTLLWATQGVTKQADNYTFRAAPSAGALYPINTLVAILNVERLQPGLAQYNETSHSLHWLRSGDFRATLFEATLKQNMLHNAAAVFISVADLNRCIWRYAQRAYRYIYLDAGHMAQNTALAAIALGLGSCAIGAFYDDMLDQLCALHDTQQTAIYLTVIGHPVQ